MQSTSRNGISIGSVVFTRHTSVTNRQTDRHKDHVTPSLTNAAAAMWVVAVAYLKYTTSAM